jgi:hypothetical protein
MNLTVLIALSMVINFCYYWENPYSISAIAIAGSCTGISVFIGSIRKLWAQCPHNSRKRTGALTINKNCVPQPSGCVIILKKMYVYQWSSAFAPGKEQIVVMPDRFDIPVVMSDPQYQRIGRV